MAEASAESSTAAERARQRATAGAPPAPKPVMGAELFAVLPQVILFMLMWHSITAPQRAADARGGGRRAELESVSAGSSASPEQVVSGSEELSNRGGAVGMGGVAVGVPEQTDMAKFPVRYPMWSVGQKFELYVYLAASDTALNYSNFKHNGLHLGDHGPLLWHEQNLYL